MKTALGSALALSVLIACSGPRQPQTFSIAIAGLDGSLVPFATYDHGVWAQPWPGAGNDDTPPVNPDDVPSVWQKQGVRVPRVWRVSPFSGAPVIDAHVNGVGVIEAHCEAQAALKTDILPSSGERHLKLGVAVDGSLAVALARELKQSNPLWAMAVRIVVASFPALEKAKVESEKPRLSYDAQPRETPEPAVALEELFADSESAPSAVYFVAERRFRTSIPGGFDERPVTRVTGWLLPEAGSFRLVSPTVFLFPWHETVADSSLPMASLRVGGKIFWVVEVHGYEDERYTIAELSSTGARNALIVKGGGC